MRVKEFRDDPFVLLDVPAVRGMVARDLGFSVLVQRPPVNFSYDGLPVVAIRLEDFEPSDICIAYVQKRRSRRLREIISVCQAEAARLDAAVLELKDSEERYESRLFHDGGLELARCVWPMPNLSVSKGVVFSTAQSLNEAVKALCNYKKSIPEEQAVSAEMWISWPS